MKKLIIVLLIIHSFTFADERLDSLLYSTVNDIYSIKFKEATSTITIVKKEYPKNPAGLFFDAMITWWKIQLDPKDERYDKEFFKKTDAIIDLCEQILDDDKKNRDALFYNGGALGFKARVQTFRKKWVKAAMNGKNAIPFVHDVYELDTLDKDGLLGIGIYNYFADIIPKRHSFVKPFMLFFPKGNAKQGIRELKIVSKQGKFAKYEAQYQLMMLYYYYEKDNEAGYRVAKSLIKNFPNNPIFQKYYIRFAYKTRKYKNVDTMLKDVFDNRVKSLVGYNDRAMREFHYYSGLSHFKQGRYKNALKDNQQVIVLSKKIPKSNESFFLINTWFNKGMSEYNSKDYIEAKKSFKKVLGLKEIGTSHDRAERMLKKIKRKKK